MTGTSWVTLATNDSYSLGALVLAFSLKKVSTRHQLSVLVTPGVSDAMKVKLQSIFDVVKMVDPLDSKDTANLLLLKRPELGVTFTKLHCWTLTQFEKCVFLDADTLVLQNCDELFDREEFSAAPDVGWPDCFNSGVFVYRPSNETFASLIKFAEERGSFDGGDQGLLNLYFSGWAHTDISKHLPFIYNMCSTACYSYLPAFKQFSEGVKIIHFIGTAKPWMQHFDTETQTVYPSSEYNHLQAILQTWWNLFCTYIHPELSPEMTHSQWMYSESRHNFYVSQSQSFDPLTPCLVHFDNPSFEQNRELSDAYSEHLSNNPNVYYIKEFYDPWEVRSDSSQESFIHEQILEYSEPTSTCSHESQSTYLIEDSSEHHRVQTHSISPEPSNPEPLDNHCAIDTNFNAVFDNNSNQVTFVDEQSISNDVSLNNSRHIINYIPESEPSFNSVNVRTQIITDSDKNENIETSTTAGLAGAFAQMTLGAPRTSAQSALEDHFRRQSWEIGNIDYMGRDSFANIWQKISSTLSTSAEDESPVETPLTATPSAKASGASASQQSAAAPKGSKTSTDARKVSSPETEERSDPQTSEANITLTETSRTPQRASPPKSKATKAKSDCAPPPKAASPPKSQHPKNSKSEHATPLPTAKSHPNPSDKPTQSQQPSNEKLTEPSPGIESYPSAAAPQKPKQQSPPKKSAKEQSKPKIKPEAQLPHTVEPSCQQPTSNKPHQKSQSPPQEQRPAAPPPPAPTSQLNQPENLSSGETVKKNKKPQKDAELQPSATAAPVKQQTPPESTSKPLPPVSKKHKKGHKEPPNPVVEPQPVTVEAAPPTPSKKNKKPQKEESQAVEQSTVPTSQCQKVQPPPPVQQTQQKPVETKSTTPQRDEACPQPPPRKDKKGGGAKKGNK